VQSLGLDLGKNFDNWYFPRIVREAKAREFMNLVQGSITIAQYAAKFIELSKFALYVIPDKEMKAKTFDRGLNQKIRNWVMCLEVKNFVELVNKASIVEKDLKETTMLKANQKKRQFFRGPSIEGQGLSEKVALNSNLGHLSEHRCQVSQIRDKGH
jgi:hypothetical protein